MTAVFDHWMQGLRQIWSRENFFFFATNTEKNTKMCKATTKFCLVWTNIISFSVHIQRWMSHKHFVLERPLQPPLWGVRVAEFSFQPDQVSHFPVQEKTKGKARPKWGLCISQYSHAKTTNYATFKLPASHVTTDLCRSRWSQFKMIILRHTITSILVSSTNFSNVIKENPTAVML